MTPGASGPVVIAAGGTGGHVFPALALARALRGAGVAPAFVTDRRGTAFGGDLADVPCHKVGAGGLAGRGVSSMLRGVVNLLLGTLQARTLLRRLAPSLAVGFGGYASVPPLLAARSLGIPTLVHEANAVLGRANRLLAPGARVIATAFPDTTKLRPTSRQRLVHTGIPVRAEFVAARSVPYPELRADGRVEILAVGGSQGARVLGRTLPAALATLPAALRGRLWVVQQCREEDLDAARRVYRDAGIEATLAPFIDNVADRLAAAHLVIARAGASTVAELTVVGRPAILIPYPHATDDHQAANARAVEAAGGAWMISEHELSPDGLARRIEQVLGDPAELAGAAARSRAIGHPDAVERLVETARALMVGEDPREVAA